PNGLFEVFRHLLVLKTAPKAETLIEASPEMILKLRTLAADFQQGEVLLALSILQGLQVQLRRPVASPKLLVEAALLKLVYVDGLKSVESLIQGASSGQRNSSPIPVMEKKTLKPTAIVSETVSSSRGSVSPKVAVASGVLLKTKTSPESSEENLSLNDVERVWPQVIELVKAKRMSLSLYLAEAEPAEVDGTVIVLGLPSEFRFHKETLEKDLNKQVIEEAFAQALAKKVRVQCVVTEREGTTEDATGERAPATKDEGVPDIVSKALEIFDGSKVIRKD
ncbi:MAG: hypothetical protein PHV97_07335, partial [Candidatus Omnitrophica bacterium]|nr:hypothetical protein [Candidatus Omnitrophota bacterium]